MQRGREKNSTQRRPRAGLLLGAVVFLFSGCAYFGPDTVHGNRNPYNIAIQKTSEEQMLLNLVRLKYRDTPFFLEVSSVATQFTYNAGLAGVFTHGGDISNIFEIGPSGEYEENPTVTYSPLQGEQFVKRLLSPISLETLLLLYNSGWSVERVFELCAQRINNIRNAPRAAGPTPATAPQYKTFKRLTDLMRNLQNKDGLNIRLEHPAPGAAEHQGSSRIVMRLAEPSEALPESRELVNLLGLSPDKPFYVVHGHTIRPDRHDHIGIQTRSLMGVLYYLSQGVKVPPADIEAGKVTVTHTADGGVFDWDLVTGDLLRVHSQTAKPDKAAVSVEYRGYWFYIADSDLTSKTTFSLLHHLFALQSGDVQSTQPIYTLPLGG
ncbi:MAG: hypothetical protein QGF13_03230 [Alphaproteobacteria bacterium]|nr:hypothetical protein [Alphaproteobacteria bacterium]